MKQYKLVILSLALALIVAVPAVKADTSDIIIQNDNLSNITNDVFSDVNSGINEAINNGLKGKISAGDALIDSRIESKANSADIRVEQPRIVDNGQEETTSVIDILNTNDGLVDNIMNFTANSGQNLADTNGGIDETIIITPSTDKTILTHVGSGEIQTGMAGAQSKISTVLNSTIIKVAR